MVNPTRCPYTPEQQLTDELGRPSVATHGVDLRALPMRSQPDVSVRRGAR